MPGRQTNNGGTLAAPAYICFWYTVLFRYNVNPQGNLIVCANISATTLTFSEMSSVLYQT